MCSYWQITFWRSLNFAQYIWVFYSGGKGATKPEWKFTHTKSQWKQLAVIRRSRVNIEFCGWKTNFLIRVMVPFKYEFVLLVEGEKRSKSWNWNRKKIFITLRLFNLTWTSFVRYCLNFFRLTLARRVFSVIWVMRTTFFLRLCWCEGIYLEFKAMPFLHLKPAGNWERFDGESTYQMNNFEHICMEEGKMTFCLLGFYSITAFKWGGWLRKGLDGFVQVMKTRGFENTRCSKINWME